MPDAPDADRIRELEAENARLRLLLDRQGMPSVLRHQVRNALGLMRAVLRRSAENKTTVEDLTAHLEGRFDALLRVQKALLSSPDGCVELAAMVSEELLAQTMLQKASLDGPAVRMQGRQAEVLTLAFHELATNAVKFGPMTAPDGRLTVTWTVSPSRVATVVWAETGGARASALSPDRRGFGLTFIEEALPYQLEAESQVEFPPGGFRCTLVVPSVILPSP